MENELPSIEETREPPDVLAPVERRGSALPLILTVVALVVWFAFQTFQMFVERNSLSELKTNLEQAMQEAQKMQVQLQTLIRQTVELANQGNAAAKTAVLELEKRGIPIKGPSPSACQVELSRLNGPDVLTRGKFGFRFMFSAAWRNLSGRAIPSFDSALV